MKPRPRFGLLDGFVAVTAVAVGLGASRLYGDWRYPFYASALAPVALLVVSAWLAWKSPGGCDRKRCVALCVVVVLYLPLMVGIEDLIEWVAWTRYSDFSTSLEGPVRGLYETALALGPGLIHPVVILLAWLALCRVMFPKARPSRDGPGSGPRLRRPDQPTTASSS